MPGTVIRRVAPNIWTFSRPFARFGLFPVGGRSTAIKLHTGGVWVLASTTLNSETKTKLDELGEVKYIMGANAVHWLFLAEFKKAYPSAKVIGVEPLMTKKGCVRLDGAYGHDSPDTKYGFEDEITPCYFSGSRNKDVAFYHPRSKTALVADLLFNLPATEQYSMLSKRPYLLQIGVGPMSWAQRTFAWMVTVNKEAMNQDSRTVASWDIDTIIPCHGDIIESQAKEAWRAAYKAHLP